MQQLCFEFSDAPSLPEFCGPFGYITRPDGEFYMLCPSVVGKASFNSLAPASWTGFYMDRT